MPPKPAPVLDLKFVKVPMPWWAVQLFGGLAILFLGAVASLWTVDTFFKPPDNHAKFQLEMFQKHFGVDPSERFEIFNDERGKLEILYYAASGAISTIRKSPDSRIPPTINWVSTDLEALNLPALPGTPRILNIGESGPSGGFVFAGGFKGQCISIYDHVQAPFNTEVDDCSDEGWCKFWHWWKDGCEGFYWIYPYYGGYYWEVDEDNNPIFHWTNCTH